MAVVGAVVTGVAAVTFEDWRAKLAWAGILAIVAVSWIWWRARK